MKKSICKVKRPTVDWNQVRLDLANPDIEADFYMLLKKHPKMSHNRISYNVLKKHYSISSLERLRWLGVPLQ